ncbi:MAG: reverse transcriptase domain-containing protein [Blastocatellia bacterium]
MDKNRRYFEELCDRAFLIQSWKSVRANRGAAGVDQVSVYEYERNLVANIDDLRARLRDGRYIPMPFVHFKLRKANGKTRSLGIATVEDRIVSRALHDLLERIWEPAFMACSYGFRPGRNVEMAVKHVLDYRAAGDCFVVDADIADCFGSLDHELVLGLIAQRIRDKRLLGLIRLVLASGQASPALERGSALLSERVADFAASAVGGAVNDAMTGMLGESGYGYAAYDSHPAIGDPGSSTDSAAELRGAARREACKRLGRDALLLGLTYVGRSRRLLSPASLALTGAAVLATAAYPAATRLVRNTLGRRSGSAGAMQGSALSPLLANIVLHEFDQAMIRAGFHLVRYADDWVVTCRDAESAERALDFAARKLAELRLAVNPEKTRIIRFEQGLEFLGYRFDQFQLTATPAPTSTQRPISALWREAPAAAAEARRKLAPIVARASEAARQTAGKVADLFKRDGRDRKD